MIDPHAAKALRKLFAKADNTYPHLQGIAEILFKTKSGMRMSFQAKTPSDTAKILQHIIENENTIFARSQSFDILEPLYFRMYKIQRLLPGHKEAKVLAFNFTFRDKDKPGTLWLSAPGTTSSYWQGDEKIENKAPYSLSSPPLTSVIRVLQAADNDWKDVNFMKMNDRPQLRLVSHNP
jgi:hypothetical protein